MRSIAVLLKRIKEECSVNSLVIKLTIVIISISAHILLVVFAAVISSFEQRSQACRLMHPIVEIKLVSIHREHLMWNHKGCTTRIYIEYQKRETRSTLNNTIHK